jgi:ribosomal protein S18 acetylase RimI-like enzyme
MPAEIVVRAATADDGDAVGELTERVYRAGGFTDDEYALELSDAARRIETARVFVAEVDGHLVGSVTVGWPGTPFAEVCRDDEVEVRMLAVTEEARGRGVAGRLMDAVEAFGRARGARGVVLSTEPLMHAAHRLYGRRGYVRDPDRDWTIGHFELLAFQRDLD